MKQLMAVPFTPWFKQRLFNSTILAFFILSGIPSSFAQQWTILGNESQVAAASSSYTSITVQDNIPFVVFREGTVARVKTKNPVTGAWEQVGNDLGTNLTYTRISLDKTSNLYVTYVDAANGNKLAVKIYNSATDRLPAELTAMLV